MAGRSALAIVYEYCDVYGLCPILSERFPPKRVE